jgi:hypothetical protein
MSKFGELAEPLPKLYGVGVTLFGDTMSGSQ